MITKNWNRGRIIVIIASFAVIVDTIYALIFYFLDIKKYPQENLLSYSLILVLFWLTLILLAYLVWIGRRFAARILGIFLFGHGLLYLLGSGLTGSLLIFMLAALNLVIAVFLFSSSVAEFQNQKRKK